MGRSRIELSKKILEELYIKKNLTPLKIGEKFGCSFKTIRNRLQEYKIPFKNPAYARMKYKKNDFDGSLVEKAYMIGFRMGDLNVYRTSEKALTIVVRCHTTQQEQVDVMKSLFEKYGKVSISLKNGHFHINCFLNTSFGFLLSKGDVAWEWIKEQEEDVALAFIAGYTDAEANLILNQNRARLKIDSYDATILNWMAEWLNKQGMNTKLRIIYYKGEKVPSQSPFPKDLWRLNINDRKALYLFLQKMTPYLRHSIRIRQATIAKLNIEGKKK
jgi:hypothetical protein